MSKELADEILDLYRDAVREKHPSQLMSWPIITGCNRRIGSLHDGLVLVFDHSGTPSFVQQTGLGSLDALIGQTEITAQTVGAITAALDKALHLRPVDGVVVLKKHGEGWRLLEDGFQTLISRHERYLGLLPMKIFLSHKGVDKEMVRRFERLLRELGFDPWLDEDAMPAGSQPDRAIQKGFKDSCAAVFFVTPDFKDEKWLATEIEYARAEYREKGERRFRIITLSLTKDGQQGEVPDLLKNYIYKSPKHELEAMLEIIRGLPIKVGEPHFN